MMTSHVVVVSSTEEALYFRVPAHLLFNVASIRGVNDTIARARATSKTQASAPMPLQLAKEYGIVVVRAIDFRGPGEEGTQG